MSVARRISRPVPIALLALAGACAPPNLTSIETDTGYPRQLLAVSGSTLGARVVWDVGLPGETEISSGLFGTRYFQIPESATPGAHPVALRNSHGTSSSIDVTVLAASGVFPRPRIEDIGVFSASDAGAGNVDLAFTVAAANLDTDATLTLNASALSDVFFWSGLPIAYLIGHIPDTYGYPIYHYGQLIAVAQGVSLGSTLTVIVTNHDGQADTTSYDLPASLADLDSDGDGLPDAWERDGYPAPSGDTLDLPGMGADPLRKDMLIEVDWIPVATPNATIWATIEDAFATAPVLNPNGSAGVEMIIDRGQGGAFTGGGTVLAAHTTMDFEPVTATSPAGYASFFDYKSDAANFDPDRLNVFHYSIFGRVRPNGSSGRGEIWGNDFMVTFATFGNWGVDMAEVGTFIHELGHNLGLRHGGIDNGAAGSNDVRKPNMASTMSYRWQFPGVSNDCDWAADGFHTYSEGYYADIVEPTVNENIGICDNTPLDMNGSGTFTNGTAIDTNVDGDNTDTHVEWDQWGNLLLDFDAAGSRWNGN